MYTPASDRAIDRIANGFSASVHFYVVLHRSFAIVIGRVDGLFAEFVCIGFVREAASSFRSRCERGA